MRLIPEADDYEFAAAMLAQFGRMMARLPDDTKEFDDRTLTKADVAKIKDRGHRCLKLADAIRAEHVPKEPSFDD